MTVHNAITLLQFEGLVDRRQGKGVFVLSPQEREEARRATASSPTAELLIPLMLRLTGEVDKQMTEGFADLNRQVEKVVDGITLISRRVEALERKLE